MAARRRWPTRLFAVLQHHGSYELHLAFDDHCTSRSACLRVFGLVLERSRQTEAFHDLAKMNTTRAASGWIAVTNRLGSEQSGLEGVGCGNVRLLRSFPDGNADAGACQGCVAARGDFGIRN